MPFTFHHASLYVYFQYRTPRKEKSRVTLSHIAVNVNLSAGVVSWLVVSLCLLLLSAELRMSDDG